MVKIQFLSILLVVTCFLGGIVSVTDKELEDRFKVIDVQLLHLKDENMILGNRVDQLEEENKILKRENERQNIVIGQEHVLIRHLLKDMRQDFVQNAKEDYFQNTTIDERVTLLEIQVADIEGDISVLIENVDFLFDETVIQDERIFTLEQTSIETNEDVETLQDTTLALDFRVTALEENGGGDGNSSVAELEVRVEALEGKTADHESRISASESDLTDLEGIVADQETRLTVTEENIQGLQMTDVELDERVTALEENGGGNNENENIAFTAALTSYDTIPFESAVEFNVVLLNEGDGYDSTTGTFTVPPGGDGFYYFSAYFLVWYFEIVNMEIQINGETICTAYAERNSSDHPDPGHTSCSGVAFAAEGNTVQVMYVSGTDTTPLLTSTAWYYNGFTGFRI